MGIPKPEPVMLSKFISFVKERHQVFLRRQKGLPQEDWTNDLILQQSRFCNVYRVLDRGSQFFIQEMLADEPDKFTTLMRAAMYRMTNEPKFWKFYIRENGGPPTMSEVFGNVLQITMRDAYQANINIFRPSYMLSFGVESAGEKKHDVAPRHFFSYFHPQGANYVGERFFAADSLYGRIAALESAFRVGPFLAQQIATDVNYSEHYLDDENYRVVGGPGSRKGIQYIYGPTAAPVDYHSVDYHLIISELRRILNRKVEPLELPGGGTRELSLMDVQNCLCEFSKYVKLAGLVAKDPLKAAMSPKRFRAIKPNTPVKIVLPAHWSTN